MDKKNDVSEKLKNIESNEGNEETNGNKSKEIDTNKKKDILVNEDEVKINEQVRKIKTLYEKRKN